MRSVGGTSQHHNLPEQTTPPTKEEEKSPPPSSLQTSVPKKKKKPKIRLEYVEFLHAETVGAKFEETRPQKKHSDRPKYLARPNTPRDIDVTKLTASLASIGEEGSTAVQDLTSSEASLPPTGADIGTISPQQFTASPKASPGAMRLPDILPGSREKSMSTSPWEIKKIKKPGDRPNIAMSPRGAPPKLKYSHPLNLTLSDASDELPPIVEDNPALPAEIPTTAPRPTEDTSTTSGGDLNRLEDQRVQRDLSKREKTKALTRRDVAFQRIAPPAPDSSTELATLIKALIRKNPSPVLGVVRVLNMFHCAAGGTISRDPALPETGECAAKLSNLLQDQRYEYLQALYDQLEFYLLPPQRELISRHLERLKDPESDMMAYLEISRLTHFIEQEIMRISK